MPLPVHLPPIIQTVCFHSANSCASVRTQAWTNHQHVDFTAPKEPFVRASFPRTMHAPLGMTPRSTLLSSEEKSSQLLTLALTNESETAVLSISYSAFILMTCNSTRLPSSGKCRVLNLLHARSKQGEESKGFSPMTRLVPVPRSITFQNCSKRHLPCWRSESELAFQVTTRQTRSSRAPSESTC